MYLIIGVCNTTISVHTRITLAILVNSDSSEEYQLLPGRSMVFTWSDPCKKREIEWWLLAKKEAKNILEIKV